MSKTRRDALRSIGLAAAGAVVIPAAATAAVGEFVREDDLPDEEFLAASEIPDAAFIAILDRANRPTTPLGVAAVLRLVADSHANGEPEFAGKDEEGRRQTWSQAVERMCAEVLERMTLARS